MLKQSLQQKLQQKLSPQQIQLMKLLQLPMVELEKRIKEELEENPALEESAGATLEKDSGSDSEESEPLGENERDFDLSDYFEDDTPGYKLNAQNYNPDQENRQQPISMGATFYEQLIRQIGLRLSDDQEIKIAAVLIGNLDDSGYLRREMDALVDDLAFSHGLEVTEEEIESVLKIIQDMDPPGIGARDLQESLLIQIKRKNQHDLVIKNATYILENLFEAFTKKHYTKIVERTNIDEEDLKLVIKEIQKLNPKPGGVLNETEKQNQVIIPDFIVEVNDGEIDLKLNRRNTPELRISRSYSELLENYANNKKKATKPEKDTVMFVRQKLDSAKWFIDAIKQRQETLLKTMTAIIERQRPFFLEGDEGKMRPMILKDIAEKVDLDISTISRVVNSKYVESPYGIFKLKYFFSESITTQDGQEVSTIEVKKVLREIIEAEDKSKPVTDEKLTEMLKEQNYNIARRTVAKYREQLNIPVARLRKQL